ncbi:unnamed protein product [Amoebophrya sp. A25]|nr:unnamed protein product [Amoebophrya sp. A25]|eukprot:GSA25T00007782001.1
MRSHEDQPTLLREDHRTQRGDGGRSGQHLGFNDQEHHSGSATGGAVASNEGVLKSATSEEDYYLGGSSFRSGHKSGAVGLSSAPRVAMKIEVDRASETESEATYRSGFSVEQKADVTDNALGVKIAARGSYRRPPPGRSYRASSGGNHALAIEQAAEAHRKMVQEEKKEMENLVRDLVQQSEHDPRGIFGDENFGFDLPPMPRAPAVDPADHALVGTGTGGITFADQQWASYAVDERVAREYLEAAMGQPLTDQNQGVIAERSSGAPVVPHFNSIAGDTWQRYTPPKKD